MDTTWPPAWPKMAEELYVFDPKGDVLLILGRCSEEDIVAPPVDEDMFEETRSLKVSDTASEVASEAFVFNYRDDAPPLAEAGPSWSDPEPEPGPVPREPEAGEPEKIARSVSSASSRTSPKIQEVQMRVSSKHLILASATFCTSLGSDKYSEGRTLKTEGNLVVLLPDEDPDAMTILLYIIHGLTRKVPRQVSLEVLTKIAFVVNHRQMQEAVELFSDTWIENLKQNGLPDSYTPEVLSWLFISWVFQKEDDFKIMSQILERESDDSPEDEVDACPHTPASILGAIQTSRIDGIESMLKVVHDLITKYSGPKILCRNNNGLTCDAMLLGSLLKGAAVTRIWPPPKHPYPGITIKMLADQIRGIDVLDDSRHHGRGGGYYTSGNGHGIKDSMEASIRSLEDRMCGLELKSFLPKKDT